MPSPLDDAREVLGLLKRLTSHWLTANELGKVNAVLARLERCKAEPVTTDGSYAGWYVRESAPEPAGYRSWMLDDVDEAREQAHRDHDYEGRE